jgi:hypothetical protein
MELSISRADLRDVDVKKADRVGFELALARFIPLDLWKPGDAAALQTEV